jgi:hypothetical protein
MASLHPVLTKILTNTYQPILTNRLSAYLYLPIPIPILYLTIYLPLYLPILTEAVSMVVEEVVVTEILTILTILVSIGKYFGKYGLFTSSTYQNTYQYLPANTYQSNKCLLAFNNTHPYPTLYNIFTYILLGKNTMGE